MRVKGSQVYIALVCLLLGIMFAVQYKASTYYEASLVPPSIEDLDAQLASLTKERDAAEQKVAELNQRLEKRRNSNELMANMQKDLQRINLSGGLYPCQGPGISITINNRSSSFQKNELNNGSFAEATYLLLLINELKDSGAEAITINDQRIMAMSEVYWTGTMIVVNGNQVRAPYHILAIGDPDNLEAGMLLKGGFVHNLQFHRQIDLKKVDPIIMPAFNGPTPMNLIRIAR